MTVSATSASVNKASKEITLERVPYIQYPVQFQKNKNGIQALLNSNSEFNIINLAYAKKLGLHVRQADVGAQKIDGFHLNIFRIIIAGFLL